MKKLITFVVCLFCITISSLAQSKLYGVFESKTLFQMGLVEDSAGHSVSGPIRFAPFANYTIQAHKDISNKFGLYTGIGVKNVGFISKIDDPNLGGEVRVKSRAYCLSIPLGIKFGNMKEERYFYLAGEFLAQVDYKEKVFIGDDKSKRKNDNDINKINYSGVVGFNMKNFTLGVEYTLNNFYGDNYNLVPSNANPTYSYPTPSKSNILTFFIGFRTSLSAKEAAAPEKKQLQQARALQY